MLSQILKWAMATRSRSERVVYEDPMKVMKFVAIEDFKQAMAARSQSKHLC